MVKRILVNVSGTKLTDEERKNLRAHQPLGVVLFAENIDTYEQVKELIKDIKSTLDHDLVCIAINLFDECLFVNLDKMSKNNSFRRYDNMLKMIVLDKECTITCDQLCKQSEEIANILSDLGINTVYGFNKDEYQDTYFSGTKLRYCLTESLSALKFAVGNNYLMDNVKFDPVAMQEVRIKGCDDRTTVLKCRIIAKTMEDRNINCIIDSVPNPSRRANPSRRDDKNNKELALVVQSGWAEKYAMVSDACYKEDAVSFMPQAKILISCKELNLDDQDVRCAYKMMHNAFASGVDICFFIDYADKGFSLFNFLAEADNAHESHPESQSIKSLPDVDATLQEKILKSFSPFSTTITQANARDFSPPSSFVAHDFVAEASGYSFDKWK